MFLFQLLSEHSGEFIALSALALAIYEGASSRKHNRLSVKPVITHQITWDKNDEGEYEFVVKIINHGLGPARILQVVQYLNGLKKPDNLSDFIQKIANELTGDSELVFDVKADHPTRNYHLAAGEEFTILSIKCRNNIDTQEANRMAEILNRFELLVFFQDLYGYIDIHFNKRELCRLDRVIAIYQAEHRFIW